MFSIRDDSHGGELIADGYETFEAAMAALRALAELPWDEAPNRAPCGSWATCGRDYVVSAGGAGQVHVVRVSAAGTEWLTDPRAAAPPAEAPGVLPPQNVYDDEEFFAGYSRMERFGDGWTRAFEHRAFMALLPEATGLRVLDLGCGTGQLAHHLATRGAASVVGVDISERMLAIARERPHPRVTYQRAAIEDVDFPSEMFDLVVSAFAVHYVADYRRLCEGVSRWLAPGGHFVFSNEHPVYLSRATSEGWVNDATGKRLYWALDSYGHEGLREETWFVPGVRKYHRMVSTLLNGLLEAGLVIERVVEPQPDAEMLERRPDWADAARAPFAILIRARNP